MMTAKWIWMNLRPPLKKECAQNDPNSLFFGENKNPLEIMSKGFSFLIDVDR